jgi:AraC-like DNA-binding protein
MDGGTFFLHMSAFSQWPDDSRTVALAPLCGRVRFPPDWSSGADWWRTLADHDLWFVWAGRGRMEIDGAPVALHAGSCVWMEPGRRYVTTHDPQHPLGVNYFHFTLPIRDRRARPAPFEPPFSHVVVRHFGFADTLMQMILAVRAEPAGLDSANHLFAALLRELVRESTHGRPLLAGLSAEHTERMHAAAARIRHDPAGAPTVAELAREFGYSVSHFSRTFAAVTGQRPQAFTIGVKLERARELLATTGLTIGEIAAAVGVPDLFYFSRLFKQRVGATPSEFRRRVLSSGA